MDEILDELEKYCKSDHHTGAVLLTGGWGCGKTYLILPGVF
ncbi:MAG: P-loop NTPase fold protein [Intestinibaculum porci]